MEQVDIRCEGMSYETVLHAIRNRDGEWHWTSPEWAGVMRGRRENMVTELANQIGQGKIHRISIYPRNIQLYIDRMGGTWHDNAYWSPYEYLLQITEEREETPGEEISHERPA